MTQTRLHFVASNPRAGELFEAVEREFEDDSRPLAMQETDEESDIHEISIYTSDPNCRTSTGSPNRWKAGRRSGPDAFWFTGLMTAHSAAQPTSQSKSTPGGRLAPDITERPRDV